MATEFTYLISKEFSKYPGGRRRAHGNFSGEEFREDVVLPLLEKHDLVTFDLSGSAGYSSGFLDEAFGELGAIFGLLEVKRRVHLVASDDLEAVQIAWDRVADAASEAKKG